MHLQSDTTPSATDTINIQTLNTKTMEVKIINNRPMKIWTNDVEETARKQIENLTTLPFLFHHLAVMPDVHAGMYKDASAPCGCNQRIKAKAHSGNFPECTFAMVMPGYTAPV